MSDTQTSTETPKGETAGTANGAPPANTDVSVSDVTKLIDAIKSSQRVSGDDSKALEVFAGQIIAKDKRINELKAQAGQLPSDVQAELETYRELGKPDELKTRLERESTLSQEKEQRERADAFRQAATIAGYDADALLEILPEVPEVAVTGDETKVATIKAGDESKPFGEFIQAKYSKIHDSLKAQGNGQNGRVAAPKMGVNGGQPLNTEKEAREAQSRLYSGANF